MEKRDFYFGLGFLTFVMELSLKSFVPYGGNDDKLFKICIFIALIYLVKYLILQEISARNSANRNKNPVVHRGGSKPFSDYRREMVHL